MPLSPQEAATLSMGETMMVGSITSAIDAQLLRQYDGGGEFDVTFQSWSGMTVKVASAITRQYKAQGWRGSSFDIEIGGRVTFHLRVKEQEKE